MSARRRSERDRRRRTYGQNVLADDRLAEELVGGLDIGAGELVVEPGAGRGAITVALAGCGARVIAVERDEHWAGQLRATVADSAGLRITPLLFRNRGTCAGGGIGSCRR